MTEISEELHIKTPLLESVPLSKKAGCPVYIKCDFIQPTASFKIRGIGNRCRKAKEAGFTKIISSSGGNAGYAAAYAGRHLGMPATIVIPESTPKMMADKLRELGAEVIVRGKVWDHANDYALSLAKEDDSAVVIHPFDHPDIWEGHETLITEIKDQLCGKKPDAVVTCVGGGGLMCGIVQGLQRVGWRDVPVVAMETFGAESYHAAVQAGKLVTLPDITSVAKSLGSLRVAERCLELSQEHPILSQVINDKQAVDGCLRFLDDHRVMVEPACGAVLASVYSDILSQLQSAGKLPSSLSCVVVVVCGGACMSLQHLLQWKEQFNL